MVQQRGLQRHVGHLHRPVFAGSAARTHQRYAAVAHHGLHIGEIDVHRIFARNHLGDPAGCGSQNIIGLAERLGQRQLAEDLLNVLVVDQQQRIDAAAQLLDPLLGLPHPFRALGLERKSHDGHRQDTQLLGCPGDHRRRAGSGSTAHTGRDEDHLGAFALVNLDDLVEALQSRLSSFFRIVAGAQAVLSETHLYRDGTVAQRLRIGIAHHERNVGDLQLEHVVDGIATAAADTRNHDDRRRQLRNFKIDYIFYVRHILNLLRFSHSFHYDRRGPKPIRPRR